MEYRKQVSVGLRQRKGFYGPGWNRWTVANSVANLNEYAIIITDLINKCEEDCVLKKLIRKFLKLNPWMNREIHSLLNREIHSLLNWEIHSLVNQEIHSLLNREIHSLLNQEIHSLLKSRSVAYTSGNPDLERKFYTGNHKAIRDAKRQCQTKLETQTKHTDTCPWRKDKNRSTNISKMKELVIGFRKWRGGHAPVCTNVAEVEVVKSVKFLG
eukprot:g30482.t1